MRRVWLLIVGPLLLSACRVDARTSVDVEASGEGSITLDIQFDQEAWNQSGGLIPKDLTVRLKEEGWKVTETNSSTDHLVTIKHNFDTPQEGNQLIHSLGQPYDGLKLTRKSGPVTVEDSLKGQVDFTNGFYAFAKTLDPTVTELRDVSDDDIALKLVASLSGKKAEIQTPWGEATKVSIVSTAARRSTLLIGVGVLIGLFAIMFLRKPIPVGRRMKKDSDNPSN